MKQGIGITKDGAKLLRFISENSGTVDIYDCLLHTGWNFPRVERMLRNLEMAGVIKDNGAHKKADRLYTAL